MSHLVKSGSAMGPLFSLFVLFLKTSCICSWLTGKCLFYVDVEEFPVATTEKNVSGYVCNHGSPSGERDTASPRGRYGERLQRDSCLKIHM